MRLGETLGKVGGTSYMKSLIYREPHREVPAISEATDVVHEIGHLFQQANEDFHLHTGVMAPGFGAGAPRYADVTLERIRSRNFSAA